MAHFRIVLAGLIPLCVFQAQSQEIKSAEKPIYGELRCRADAQAWTIVTLTEKQKALNISSLGILVNGQARILPLVSFGVTFHELELRASEMSSCQLEDADFQKQFNTYALIERQYSAEIASRYNYFLFKHHLLEQFAKEDNASFK